MFSMLMGVAVMVRLLFNVAKVWLILYPIVQMLMSVHLVLMSVPRPAATLLAPTLVNVGQGTD